MYIDKAQTTLFGLGLNDGHVVHVEATHIYNGVGAHAGYVHGEVAHEDIAIDIGNDEVEGAFVRQRIGIAQKDERQSGPCR